MSPETTLKTGEIVPDFLLRDLDGHPHTLSHYRGQIVVVNFWSAECPWSKRADEEIADLRETWESRVVWMYIAPNANETLEEIGREANNRKLPLVLHDHDRLVAAAFGAETTPHIYVIDVDGRLRYQGAFDDVTFRKKTASTNYLREAVNALLAGKSPPVGEAQPYGCTIVHYPEG